VNTDGLAAPLLRLAARVLTDVPPADARPAAAAVRAFAGAPSPARYLAATRALRDADRRHKLGALGRAVGPRRADHGLDVLSRGAALGPALQAALRALPPDARNGRRLTLIAELIAAHELIEARADGGLRELQAALGPLPEPKGAERRRAARGKSTRGDGAS
jgi:hypothetical protein